MPVPVVLATCAAVGSMITSVKSGWELRRMIKRKQEQFVADDEAPYVFRRLRRAHRGGILNDKEYEEWYEKFLVARAERDLHALHRIRAHLRIMEAGAPGNSMSPSGSSRNASRSKSSSTSPPPSPASSKPRRRRRSVDDAAPSPRRSPSRHRRQRRDVDPSSEDEEEESDYYDEKRRTRRRPRPSRSNSVSYEDRDPRREMTWPAPASESERNVRTVGAPPEQFIRGPMKRASTVTGYGATDLFAPVVEGPIVPVPKLMAVPKPKRSSSTSAAAGGRGRSSSVGIGGRRYAEPESESSSGSESEEEETDWDEKRWMKKTLPPPRKERRRPWEREEKWGRDEKREKVRA